MLLDIFLIIGVLFCAVTILYVIFLLTIDTGLCVFKNNINIFLRTTNKVLKRPDVILNLSYGLVINGLFGIINFTGYLSLVGFVLLTLVGLLGIINTAEKI